MSFSLLLRSPFRLRVSATATTTTLIRPLTTSPHLKMPEQLTQSEINSKTDPTVAKQWDNDVPLETKFKDYYAIADKLGVCLLGTLRPNIGPVHRSMAISKRSGPDFLFLGNAHSQKFNDIETNPGAVTVTFQNSSSYDWVSVTGEAVASSNEDPRIKEIWSKGTSAWFGDLGDGVHTGGPEDPRMKLIEVKAKCEFSFSFFCVCIGGAVVRMLMVFCADISYWKADVGTLGLAKEVLGAMATGGVAVTGKLREMKEDEIKQARQKDGSMSS